MMMVVVMMMISHSACVNVSGSVGSMAEWSEEKKKKRKKIG